MWTPSAEKTRKHRWVTSGSLPGSGSAERTRGRSSVPRLGTEARTTFSQVARRTRKNLRGGAAAWTKVPPVHACVAGLWPFAFAPTSSLIGPVYSVSPGGRSDASMASKWQFGGCGAKLLISCKGLVRGGLFCGASRHHGRLIPGNCHRSGCYGGRIRAWRRCVLVKLHRSHVGGA